MQSDYGVNSCKNCAWYEYDDLTCYNNDSEWSNKVTEGEKNCKYWEERPKENLIKHKQICGRLNEIYQMKNADYGDSFHLSYLDEGMAMPRVRLGDKYRRFCQLTKSGEQHVQDESVRDTLLDLANYAIMTVMEIDRENATRRSKEKSDEEGGI